MSDDKLAVFSLPDIERMGEALAKSGLFGFKKPEEAVALMLVAQAQGRHPASVAEEYDIIQGRPALRSRAALARFQIAGGRIEWLKRTDSEVSARFSHPQSGELVVTWTIDRAEKMGLAGKDNWRKQPMIMLSWRVVAEGIRASYPACLSGQYLVEEVQDFEPLPERNITPRPPIQEPTETAPEAPAEAPPPDAPEGLKKITVSQQKTFWAKAKSTGFSEEEVRERIKSLGFESTKDITVVAYDALCRWAEGPKP